MGILDYTFLWEADDDGGNATGGTASTDTGADAGASSGNTGDANTTDNAGADANAGNDDNANPDDDGIKDPDNGEDDFSIDTDFDDKPDDDTNNAGGDDTGGGGSTSSSPNPNPDDEPVVSADSLKAKDADLYEDLEPAQQEIKLRELKERYMSLYATCDNVIEKINTVSKDYPEINDQLKRVVNILFTNKKMIADYYLHIFDSKSYLENDNMYNYYLSVLNTVKNVTKELKNGYNDTNTQS